MQLLYNKNLYSSIRSIPTHTFAIQKHTYSSYASGCMQAAGGITWNLDNDCVGKWYSKQVNLLYRGHVSCLQLLSFLKHVELNLSIIDDAA